MSNYIPIAPWKVDFSILAEGPYVILTRLIDLIGVLNNDTKIVVPYDSNDISRGYKLAHDIICFNTFLYDRDTGVLLSENQLKTIFKDDHTVQHQLKKYAISISKVDFYDNTDRKEYSFNGIITYKDGKYYDYDLRGIKPPLETDFIYYLPDNLKNQYYILKTLPITVGRAGGNTNNVDLILTTQNEEITQILSKDPQSVSLFPYSKMYLNPNTTKLLVAFLTGLIYTKSGSNYEVIPYDNLAGTLQSIDVLNLNLNPALAYTYVWVKVSLFADFVTASSYQQNLNKQSNVVHKNIIIGKGDFDNINENNEIYLPNVTPRITTALKENEPTPGNYIDVNDCLDPNDFYREGFFPIPETIDGINSNYPIGWYNPRFPENKKNLFIPKKGNMYLSGRLFSPTIDELWYTLKTLIEGRESDSLLDQNNPDFKAFLKNINSKYDTSVLIPETPHFDLPNNKKGDPLNKLGTLFVNAPTHIKYYISILWKIMLERIFPDGIIKPYLDKITPITFNLNDDEIYEAEIDATNKYGPRKNPYSLRELELYVKNLEVLTVSVLNALTSTSVVEGKIDINGVGTLYKLHRDYSRFKDSTDTLWENHTDTNFPNENEYGDHLIGGDSYDYKKDHTIDDIYLAADGSWRYLFDSVRLPILDEPY